MAERAARYPDPIKTWLARMKASLAGHRSANKTGAPESASGHVKFTHCWFCHQFTARGACAWCGIDTEATAEKRATITDNDPFLRIQRRFAPGLAAIAHAVKVPIIRWNAWEHIVLVASAAKWSLLASLVGVLAGSASAAFLALLTIATAFRMAHPWLLWLLPLCGLLVGFVYHKWGKSVERGNNLILDQVHKPAGLVPLLMTPFILISTVLTHLFGGSAGREGTAIQMGGSLAAWLGRRLNLHYEDLRLILMAGMSAGFGSVFGTPLAGAVFGMEVQSVGRIRYEGIMPCLIASVVGDRVCKWWGIGHSHYQSPAAVSLDATLLLKLAFAGIIFGLVALLFSELTHTISERFKRRFSWPPLRPAIGGIAIIAMTYLVGSRDYLGLSLPLLSDAVDGNKIVIYAFALKLIFTAVTLGAGFKGGEVTPLFVIGATLGYAIAIALGAPPTLFAAVGFVAVFGAAANTPIACLLMGIELFGGSIALPYGIACVFAYVFSGHRGIYLAQRVEIPKAKALRVNFGETLHDVRERATVVPLPLINASSEVAD
jgi:H+/Cl- antiporter ClcA